MTIKILDIDRNEHLFECQRLLHYTIRPDALRDFCLGLVLLSDGLLNSFVVKCLRDGTILELLLADSQSRQSTVVLETSRTKLSLCSGHSGYLRKFLLEYYRDGTASVDHVDIEAKSAGRMDGIDVTFAVDKSITPVTSDEAYRRLKLNYP